MNKVILLIPHYNNPNGLYKSLKSIGIDEFLDIIVVDDGSTIKFDESKVTSSYLGKGVVSFKYLKENKGIEIALNQGLEFILSKKYKLTARLDCGDICVKDRFKIQEKFLELNNEVALVGSNVDFVNLNGDLVYTLKVPEKDKLIRKKMFINAMHIHPTIMFKNNILEIIGLYPIEYKAAEDYAFFFSVTNNFKVANINKVLVKCELNPKGISTLLRKIQAKNRVVLILKNFYFGFYPIYGLLRSCLLYILPLSLLIKLKSLIKN
ncbi:glycosyltransferase [Polaribacter sp. Z014]|uniref:glycosyltransferase n=1 Tax=Polaribacter sp. Z014 TaxID=2927126 RepID=UPI0020221133|nr:glycosyltransferase [Polaribacter sp. Z014]MCL7761849.1 glycosyltransferase [Polaribacter sp. Z014]